MEENKRIKKVHILTLIQKLGELYNEGVDFVDIWGVDQADGDEVILAFNKNYMDPESIEHFMELAKDINEEETPSNIKAELSDDDLNQLV